MARQEPWESDPVVALPRQRADPRINEREQAETRYRNATGDRNPLSRPVILPGEEGYAGTQGQLLPEAGVVVADTPWANDPAISPSRLAADAEAARRLGTNGDAAAREGQIFQGLSLGLADEAAGIIAGVGQQGRNVLRNLNGEPIEIQSRDLRDAVTEYSRAQNADFARERPVESLALQLAGGALTGGAGAGRAGLANAVRTGAGYGAAYGFGTAEGSFAERLPEAAIGGVAGGVTGGAVQIGTPFAQRLIGIAGAGTQSVTSRLPGATGRRARAATRNGGTPETGAAIRLNEYIGPEQFARRDEARRLGVDLSVVDTLDNTGERAIRSAAGPAGPGADAAVDNLVARQANLKPEVMAVTRGLSPDARTAPQLTEDLGQLRSTLAERDYAPAYATPVQVTEDVLSALSDEPGRAALRRARQAAVARRDATQVQEIDGLLAGDIQEVSAGTLDRVRIALGNRAEALGRNATGARDVAGGLRGRASDIDAALETVPDLAPARAAYRDLSGAIESIEGAADIFSTDPADFAARAAQLTPTQREAMIVGVRQVILDALGRQRNAGDTALQTIAQAPYSRQNLAALLGQEEADRYLGSIALRVGQAQRAARISPNTNSQTFGRMQDDETFNVADAIGAVADGAQALRGSPAGLARTIERVAARATLTADERAAIVNLGLGSADELERIVALAQQARQANRPPPREVRAFVGRARNVLGSNSPVVQQIEGLLVPTRVAAEEDQGQEP
jgi:hypothetical protein